MATLRPYLSTGELTQLTPWSADAVEAKVRRGDLVLGVHFFQPNGRRGERVWKWSAVVAYIEDHRVVEASKQNSRSGRVIDVEKAEAVLRRMCDQRTRRASSVAIPDADERQAETSIVGNRVPRHPGKPRAA